MCLTGNGDGNAYPHHEWGCDSPGMHILTGKGDVPHRECISSPEMGMSLTWNAYPHWEWGCAPLEMQTLTGNAHSLERARHDHMRRSYDLHHYNQ